MNRLPIAVVVSGVCLITSISPEARAEIGLPATTAYCLSSVDSDRVPEGLSAGDWSSIRTAYEAGRHAVFPVEGNTGNAPAYQASNPEQQWRTEFDGRGFLVTPDANGPGMESPGWSWGLELVGHGRGGAERAVPNGSTCVAASGGHLSYEWDDNLTEWYINDQRGLEHGYTLHWRQDGSCALQFTLAVRGDLAPHISTDRQSITFVNAHGAAVVNYTGLKVFDANGADVPAWFVYSTSDTQHQKFFRLVIDDTYAVYPLTIDPVAQQAYLKASNTEALDYFGASVAVSGDTVVIGASGEKSSATGVNGNQADNSASDAGAAYVFVRAGGVWSQQAYLKASNTGGGDYFGLSVAVSGDTVVIGAIGEDSSATGVNGNQADNITDFAGAAYVFVRSGTVWSQQAYLKASNSGFIDTFGYSVAISGDTVVVGANQEDSNAGGVNGNQADDSAGNSGAAYVFVRSGTVWSQHAYLKASNTEVGDQFGYSVAVSGDTVVVGAFGEDSNASGVNGNQAENSAADSGAAYVFVRTDGFWSQQAYLKASNTGVADQFGISVGTSGDTVVVGASGESSSATGVNGNQADNSADAAGAAFVFVRDGGVWTQQAYLKASNTEMGDRFGYSVAVSSDTVVVGAISEDSSATGVNGNQADNSAAESGAAYVFVRGASVWGQQAYLKASNTGAGDIFGRSVAVSGDTVVVGADGEASNAGGVNGNQADNSATNAGAAYAVAGLGPDADGDGTPDLLDGCPGDTTKTAPGTCGCGTADSDSDADGTVDCNDGCPNDANKTAPGACGCGKTDANADGDGDGVLDCNDKCPGTPACALASVGADGCPADANGDGISDGCETPAVGRTSSGLCGACGGGTPLSLTLSIVLMTSLRRRFRGRE